MTTTEETARLPWPVAVATHAARDLIGPEPEDGSRWTGLESFATWAAETGFDGVDASSSVLVLERPDGWWRDVAAVLADRGLRLASLNCLRSSLADPDHWHLGDARIRRAFEVARLLDVPTVNVSLAVPAERLDANAFRQVATPPGSSRSAAASELSATVERLRVLYRWAGEDAARLVLELHHCSVVDTADSLRDVLDQLADDGAAHPVLGNPDLVNELWAFDRIESPWQESLAHLAPVSGGIWHLKNVRQRTTPEGHQFVDASLGDGDIDYRAAVATMGNAGFQGWLSIERAGAGDFRTTATDGLHFLRSLRLEQH